MKKTVILPFLVIGIVQSLIAGEGPPAIIPIIQCGLYRLDSGPALTHLFHISTGTCQVFGDIYIFPVETQRNCLLYDAKTNFIKELSLDTVERIIYIDSKSLIVIGTVYHDKIFNILPRYEELNIFETREPYDITARGVPVKDTNYLSRDKKWILRKEQVFIGEDRDFKLETIFVKAYGVEQTKTESAREIAADKYLVHMFGKEYILDLAGILPGYDYSNLLVLYDSRLHCYFISANNYGRLE